MASISHIKDLFNNISYNNFIFSQNQELLSLFSELPDHISFKLLDSDFIFHLSELFKHLSLVNLHFSSEILPLLKSLKNHKTFKEKMVPYADFFVDEPPIFKKEGSIQLSFEDILTQALKDGRPLSPVKRRSVFSFQGTCPYCGAPKEYIYDNNKGRGQLQCKACRNTFTSKTTICEESAIYCPHCKYKLVAHHDRKGYIVYKCQNPKCSYYLNNKRNCSEKNKTTSDQWRFHYHYREFKFNLNDLKSAENSISSPVSLSKIHFDEKILGLVLTYYVNYGLSSRKTALILKQVHGLKISHQTILNYASTVASHMKPLIDKYKYKLSNVICGDETYIKVRGKNHYIFFFSDPKTKVITSYTIYPTRDTKCACESLLQAFSHYEEIPKDLLVVTDGNPIYNAAQIFFKMNGIEFDLQQVIGVKNMDETSKKYRPFKQIEERLNRTYKQNYYGTNGYDSLKGANSYMVLFVAFFNFLRPHSSLNFNTPVDDGLFNDDMLMQDQWLKLIEESHKYH